jgi:hypothetical protein
MASLDAQGVGDQQVSPHDLQLVDFFSVSSLPASRRHEPVRSSDKIGNCSTKFIQISTSERDLLLAFARRL